MAKKEGFFTRLRKAISGAASDAVDAVRDPGSEIALAIDDLAAEIKRAEKDLKTALVERKVMERKIEELRAEVGTWQQRAERAVAAGDEDLARAALRNKQDVAERLRATEEALAEQRALVERMKSEIDAAKRRWKSLDLRRGTLMAQARAQKAQLRGGGAVGDDPLSRLSAIESRIAEMEAMQEVAAELSEDQVEAAAVDARFAELERDRGLDDELEALKAKMRDERALPEGTSE
ncbi:MAG: PspA/IM30 family protein [Deltaproteobacteria bacterium]|nr:MAG: PspA/IM30 family protein [Deltaproteobacteria bacterium]